MNSGMYAALSGNLAAMQRLDVVANNLANANTPGFKRDRVAFDSVLMDAATLPAEETGRDARPVLSNTRFGTDFTAGALTASNNPLDMAIGGDGFFVVSTPEGNRYTREGNFRLDAESQLVTVDGNPVLASGAPVILKGSRVEVNPDGVIRVDGTESGTLDVVDFDKPYGLEKTGNGLFKTTDPAVAPRTLEHPGIQQGFLERSNVDAITEMVNLIEASRYFESCQRMVRNYDDMSAKAANELGRV